MIRRQVYVVIAAGLLLLVTGCKTTDNSIPPVEIQDRIIQTATLLDDPSMVQLTWDPVECESFRDVEVDLVEDFANLLIKVTVDVEKCPAPGASETVADLGEPLGERRIWDKAFGNTVALSE